MMGGKLQLKGSGATLSLLFIVSVCEGIAVSRGPGIAKVPLRLRGGSADAGVEAAVQKFLANPPSYVMERHEFNHVLRVFNTNLDGTRTVLYALTKVKGVGRRFGDAVIKRAGVDGSKRAGELTVEEVEKIVQVIENPQNYDIPAWMLNRRKDYKTGKDLHNYTNKLDLQLREDLDRLRKIRCNRGLRHAWGFKVRGQHTKSTGRGHHSTKVAGKKPGKK